MKVRKSREFRANFVNSKILSALKDLIARLKRLPEIDLCSSDSENEQVIVPKISNIAHDDINSRR